MCLFHTITLQRAEIISKNDHIIFLPNGSSVIVEGAENEAVKLEP